MLWWWLACRGVDPQERAVEACEALPALSLDAVGQLLLADLAVPEELEHWRVTPRTRGLKAMGLRPFGAFRANVACTVAEVGPSPGGGWSVRLDRSEPRVDVAHFEVREMYDGPRVVRPVHLEVRPDGRVRTGVLDAWRRYREADALGREGRWEELVRAWEALHRDFPDPTLLWELAEAREAARLVAEGQGEPGDAGVEPATGPEGP